MEIKGGIIMLWTEKYRPKRLADIVGQEHFVNTRRRV